MFFRKNKIKETKTKRGLYGNSYNNSYYSSWDNMSFIEKFAMITMPCGLGFIIWTMCDIWDLVWWMRLLISVGSVSGLIGLITLIVNFFHRDY